MIVKGLRYLRSNAIGTLALFIALGGTGYAATGGFTTGGTIRACVNEEGGVRLLKAGKRCHKGQKSVSWSQTGPQGAKGATGSPGGAGSPGAAGAVGTQGPIGPSDAYEVIRESAGILAKSNGFALKTIATLNVPPGTYAVTAKATAENHALEMEAQIVCELVAPPTRELDVDVVTLSSGVFRAVGTVALSASAELPSGGTWEFQCSTENPEVKLDEIRIQAIQVGRITKTFS